MWNERREWKKLFTLPIDGGQSESGRFQNRVDQSRIFHEFDGGQSESRKWRQPIREPDVKDLCGELKKEIKKFRILLCI